MKWEFCGIDFLNPLISSMYLARHPGTSGKLVSSPRNRKKGARIISNEEARRWTEECFRGGNLLFQYVYEGIRLSNLFISGNSPFHRSLIRPVYVLKGGSSSTTLPHSIPRISPSGYPPLYPRPSYPTIHRGPGRSSEEALRLRQ